MNQNETIVPGRNYAQQHETVNSNSLTNRVSKKTNNVECEKTPVVGFLYSISRQGIGEYWPIKLGRNTIGRSASCDIQLAEASVSDLHASISVKIMKSTGRLVASIRDEGSKTGLFLNDDELDYNNYSCKNLDVIVVGANYRILIILVDAPEYGLIAAENFVAADVTYESAPVEKKEEVRDFGTEDNDLFARPSHINVNETMDIERQGQISFEKTRCL